MDNLQGTKLNERSKIPKATSCKGLEKAKLHMDGEQTSDCQGFDTGESLTTEEQCEGNLEGAGPVL